MPVIRLLPETANKAPQLRCKVVSVGEKVETIKPNQIIFCHRNAGQDVFYKNTILKVLIYGEIYGVLKE